MMPAQIRFVIGLPSKFRSEKIPRNRLGWNGFHYSQNSPFRGFEWKGREWNSAKSLFFRLMALNVKWFGMEFRNFYISWNGLERN